MNGLSKEHLDLGSTISHSYNSEIAVWQLTSVSTHQIRATLRRRLFYSPSSCGACAA